VGVGEVPKALPSGQQDVAPAEEFNLKNADLAFGPNQRPLGWYRWASWFAQKIHESGVLPIQIKTPNAAFAVLCKGDELGLPPFAAWNLIYFTQAGRLALMSKGALAVVQSKPTFDGYKEWTEGEGETLKGCAVAKRKGQEPTVKEFTYEDAATAKLLGQRVNQYGKSYDSTYQSYLKDMLLSRARARALDIAFAAELGGIPIEGVAEDIDASEGRRTERTRAASASAGSGEAKAPLGLPPGRTDPLIEELRRGAQQAANPRPAEPVVSLRTEVVQTADGVRFQTPREPEPELPELAPEDVTLAAEIERSVDEAFGRGAPDSAKPGPVPQESGTPAAGTLPQDPVVPKARKKRPECPKCGKPMHPARGCDACFYKEREAREAAGKNVDAAPCPRCHAVLNAMNGCDVCGWPGEKDFR
jgi:hypothetical protein